MLSNELLTLRYAYTRAMNILIDEMAGLATGSCDTIHSAQTQRPSTAVPLEKCEAVFLRFFHS